MNLNKWLYYTTLTGLFLIPLTPLIVSNSLLFPFIAGKAFFFRIIVEVIWALWLILALRDPSFRPRSSLLFRAMLVFIVILILATAWSVNPFHSFWSNYERMEGLVSYLHLLAYFVILISMFKTKRLWGWFLHTSLAVNVIVIIYSTLQLARVISISQGVARIEATLGNASYLAVYTLFHIFLLIFLLYQNSSKRSFAVGYSLLLLLNLFILYNTQTRGTILGLLGGVFVSALWLAIRASSGARVKKFAIGGLAVILILVGSFVILREAAFIQKSKTLSRLAAISLEESTTRSRLMVWKMSWQGFKEHPILGWGPENYILVFNKYYDPLMYDQEPWFDRAHNVFFDWLTAAGILGLLAYLSLFGLVIFYLSKDRRPDHLPFVEQAIVVGILAAYFIHNIFVFDQLVSHLMFFSLLAYIHFEFSTNETEPKFELGAKAFKVATVAIPVLVLIALYFVNLKPLLASRQAIAALQSQYQNNDESLQHFESAFSYNTFGSSEIAEQIARMAGQINQRQEVAPELKQQYLKLAEEYMEKGIAQSPQNARPVFLTGSFYFRVGELDLAIAHLEKARELSPEKQAILLDLGSAYMKKGLTEKGRGILKETFDSYPFYNEARIRYALALYHLGQINAADKLLTEKFDTVILDDDRLLNAYIENKLYDRVVKWWLAKVEKSPEDPLNHASLGLAYFYNNNRAQAIAEFEKVKELGNDVYRREAERVIQAIESGRNPY